MRLSRYHTSQAPHVWDAASSCSLLTWLSLHLLLSFPFPFFSPTHQVLSSPSRVRRFVVFCLSATDLGGPGLHDWGVPVDEYCDFVFKKNLEGDQEFGYQFSEKARLYTQTQPHTHPHKHKHKHTDKTHTRARISPARDFCLSATDLGGPGLHDWGVPVDEYCDFVFKKILEGNQEFGYQFSEKARLASRQELDGMFAFLNNPKQ